MQPVARCRTHKLLQGCQLLVDTSQRALMVVFLLEEQPCAILSTLPQGGARQLRVAFCVDLRPSLEGSQLVALDLHLQNRAIMARDTLSTRRPVAHLLKFRGSPDGRSDDLAPACDSPTPDGGVQCIASSSVR